MLALCLVMPRSAGHSLFQPESRYAALAARPPAGTLLAWRMVM